MTKTIAEKAVEMAEANAALNAQATEQAAKLVELQASVESMTAKVSAFEAERAELTAQLAAIRAEKETLVAQIAELSATMAIAPQVKQPEGAEPIKDVTASQPEGTPQTWQQALALCNGDYVSARAKFQKVFDAYIEAHKNDQK